LGELSLGDDVANAMDQFCFCEKLFGLNKAKVFEDVRAAFLNGGFRFCLWSSSVLPFAWSSFSTLSRLRTNSSSSEPVLVPLLDFF
jgi:hypothetical protein